MSKNDIQREEFKLKHKDKEIKKLDRWDKILFKIVVLATIMMLGFTIIVMILRG